MLVILRSDAYETLSLYLDDFMIRYRPPDMEIKSREECLKFLRETLPKVTVIKNNKVSLSEKKEPFIIKEKAELEAKLLEAITEEAEENSHLYHGN